MTKTVDTRYRWYYKFPNNSYSGKLLFETQVPKKEVVNFILKTYNLKKLPKGFQIW